jgi:peptidoglycan hydrolase-like protein with peptidoglycan-binding domain
MTPRQARIALCSFLLLAAGVAVNALFLQPRPTMASRAVVERPLPRAAERMRNVADASQSARASPRAPTIVVDERTQRTARFNPDSATLDAVPDAAGEIEDSETIRAVQRELRHRGYGALVSDGVMRPVTRAAIMAYEHDQGLPLTGEASEALLKRVLLGASAAAEPSAAARKVSSARAAQVVRTVQELLAALGYQPGRIDGRLGEDTVRAIREFEMDKGLAVKGRISPDVLVRLTEAAAEAKSSPAR